MTRPGQPPATSTGQPKMRKKRVYQWACGSAALVAIAAGIPRRPFLPADIDGLEAAPGLDATLFASAPMLTNPTNLDVDARGRIWVVEGHNYRNSIKPGHPVRPEGDRIVILEDTDADGRADAQKVFYQGRDIDAAMGIAVLGNQVYVSAYENVFVFTDTNGDDRADEKKVLFKLNDVDHDHTVHAFVFGPDGRLYFNHGDQGMFVNDASGKPVVDRAGNRVSAEGKPYRKGMVFRMEPDGSRFEVLGHNFRNPYEAAVDAFGTVWQSDNDDDGNRAVRINYVMEYGNYGYTDELTGAGWRAPRTGMTDSIPMRHWYQDDPGVMPNVLLTGAGSPAGIAVYEGDLLPEVFRNTMIHAEAGTNVVRAYPVETSGAGYRGRIVNVLKAVNDPLFRPVDVAVAPDGSLFVADWYDPGVGGHNMGDARQGRIIRIAPPAAPYRIAKPDFSTPAGAARALRSPNHATRYLAYTALERMGRGAEGALRTLWGVENPRFRARALWLLARLPGRGAAYLDQALRDPDPDLRITGLRAVRRLDLDVLPYARRLVNDPSPRVRREVALALRHDTNPQAAGLWAQLASQYDGQDRWYLEALGIAADRQWDPFLAAWRARVGERWRDPAGRNLVWRARTDAALPLVADLIRDETTSREDRLRYFRALDFHRGPERERTLMALLDGTHRDQAEITGLVLTHLDTAGIRNDPRVRAALDRTLATVRGTPRFVELVDRFDARGHMDELLRLAIAEPESGTGVAAATLALRWDGVDRFRPVALGTDTRTARRAITVLGRAAGTGGAKLLEEVLLASGRPAGIRQAAVQALGQSQAGERRLLEMVEQKQLPKDLEAGVGAVLFGSVRREVREAAAKHLQPPATTTADGRTLPPVENLVQRRGNAANGRAAFSRVCAACHQVGNEGVDFGPALTEIGDKLGKGALYTSILEPSAGISFNHAGYAVRLRDGSEVVGIVNSETETELTLRLPGGVTSRYPRAQVASRAELDVSLMPDGLERAMTEQELVDLVEYLGTLRRASR